MSSIALRRPTQEDVPAIAKIVFDAFATFQDRHNFPRDFASVDHAVGFITGWVNHPKIWGVVALRDGKIAGCNFLNERNEVPGVGPVCVDPAVQGGGVGRRVMEAVIERSRTINAKSVRLVQEAYNTISLSLYASLGFEVREPLMLMMGKPTGRPASDAVVRPMTEADLPSCAALCRGIHGFDRTGELRDALAMFHPHVLQRAGEIVAYASAPSFWLLNHGVAQSESDMKDLLLGAAATAEQPLALLVPLRNAQFFRWALEQGLRVIKPLNLMCKGEYQEPRGWWYPSVEY